MRKKHTYRAMAIENVRVAELLAVLVGGCIVALDVAKKRFFVALATLAGETVKLFHFDHPTQTRAFLALMRELQQQVGADKVRAAMEPTGTYGDAVRYQLASCGVPVEMVQPKKTYDSREIFDGVPSLHDGKSAVLIAQLCAIGGVAKRWKPVEELRVRLRALVEERRHEHQREEEGLGRLEARLARHWPEYGQHLDPRLASGVTLLEQFPSPARMKADAEKARQVLRTASRGKLSQNTIEEVLREAAESLGVPIVAEEEQGIQTLARESNAARQAQRRLEEQMSEVGSSDPGFVCLENFAGTYTAAVIIAFCDPRQFANVAEFIKAIGLNLREKSSGKYQGQLKLTKRGPGEVRHVVYMLTLRLIEHDPNVKGWYEAHIKDDKQKMKAVIAVMRKIASAVPHVVRGQAFDASKLFDLKRLEKTQRVARRAAAREQPASRVKAAAPQEEKNDLPWKKYLPQGEEAVTTA